jgi:predicted nucleotidyltransferase
MTDADITEEIRARLLRAVPPGSRVFLFGARARGYVDLAELYPDFQLVVVEPIVQNRVEEAVRLQRVLAGLGAPIELHVLSEERARFWAAASGTTVSYGLREGELLVRT